MHPNVTLLGPLLALLLLGAGCVTPEPDDAIHGTLVHEDTERTYTLYVPDGLEGPAPLLVMLHGAFGTGDQLRRSSGMDAEADAHGFIVVYPDGVGRTWNAVHCCGTAYARGVDDAGFLLALVDEVSDRYPVDAGAIGVAGHSNGGFMAHRMAAEHADTFSTMAAVAGTIGGQRSAQSPEQLIPLPSRPVDVLLIHGAADDHVQYHGGRSEGVGPFRIDRSFADSVLFWVAADAAGLRDTAEGPAGSTWEQHEALDGTRVWALTHPGGHGWPADPDATALIADFFAG